MTSFDDPLLGAPVRASEEIRRKVVVDQDIPDSRFDFTPRAPEEPARRRDLGGATDAATSS